MPKAIPVTPEQLKSWIDERDELRDEYAYMGRRLKALDNMIDGAEAMALTILMPNLVRGQERDEVPEPTAKNFMGTLEAFANDAPAPLSRTVLKKMLADAGFGEKQLGNYFYSVIMRLKQSGRIIVMPNGDIWKGFASVQNEKGGESQ